MEHKFRRDLLESIRNNEFNEELFLTMAYDIIEEYNLNNYVSSIKIKDIEGKTRGKYSNKKEIEIRKRYDYVINLTHYYIELLLTLFHELEHADQKKLLDKNKTYYSKLPINYDYTYEEAKEIIRIITIGNSRKLYASNRELYTKYHDLFSFEHEANYYSIINTTSYLKIIFPELHINDNYKKTQLQLLVSGYKINILDDRIISPVEEILLDRLSKEAKSFILENDVLSTEEKMILGLPVDKKEIKKLARKFKD